MNGASGVIDKIDGFLFDKTLLLIGDETVARLLINRSPVRHCHISEDFWRDRHQYCGHSCSHAHVIDNDCIPSMIHRTAALFINANLARVLNCHGDRAAHR
jgi:type I restriction enzyme S subunit